MSDDDIDFVPGGTKSNFKDIIMSQVSQTVKLGNVEYRGGHYSERVNAKGQVIQVYIEDTRETFCNATLILALLLKPKFGESSIKKDKETMKDAFTKFKKDLKKIKKEFLDATEIEETVILGDDFYDKTEDKILLDTYRNKKLRIHLMLFSELSAELKRLNYFEMGGMTF